MADVLVLFGCALIILGGAVAVGLIARAGRDRRRLAERDRPQRLARNLADTEDLIRRINQATTDAELDRLANERRKH